MNLATIEEILEIKPHLNADRLEIAKVLGFDCVVAKNAFTVGEKVLFIHPDTVLPEKYWTEVYRKFNPKRVKAQQIRSAWSFGIVEKLDTLIATLDWDETEFVDDLAIGSEVSHYLGITKYVHPVPEEPGAIGGLPHFLIPTEETLYQKLDLDNYLGQIVDVSLKYDGVSATYYYNKGNFGACGRELEYDLGNFNKYTKHVESLSLQDKLTIYCDHHQVNLALRGEVYSKLPMGISFYSVWLIDEMRYAGTEDKHYFLNVCKELALPTVPVLEKNVVLTKELISKYDTELEKVNGQPFEGVVIKGKDFSFKVINKQYDSRK